VLAADLGEGVANSAEKIFIGSLNGPVQGELNDTLGTADGLHLPSQIRQLHGGDALKPRRGFAFTEVEHE